MAPNKQIAASHVSGSINVADLAVGHTMHHITVRLLRMWEARNFKRNGELMSLDLLLVDAQQCLIQASIHHRRVPDYKPRIKEGRVYTISNFEVVPAYERYKVTDHINSIRFTDSTGIIEAEGHVSPIKTEVFRILTYPEYVSLANTNMQLPDVVGQILTIKGSNLEDATSTQKIVMVLRLRDGSTVRLTLWDRQSSEFRQKFKSQARETIVIVCTCLNPKLFAGTLYLNSTGATKFYFDKGLETITDFMNSNGHDDTHNHPLIEHEHNTTKELEILTIQSLLESLGTSTPQEKEVICGATIAAVSPRNGWNYVACGRCSKKLQRGNSSFTCVNCNDTNAVGVLKFRVDFVVVDETGRTNFVIFDRDGRKLTNKNAEDIIVQQDKEEDGRDMLQPTPQCLQELVGKTMNFQIKITSFNYSNAYKSFTVTRVREIEKHHPQEKVSASDIILNEEDATKIHGTPQGSQIATTDDKPERMKRKALPTNKVEGPKKKTVKLPNKEAKKEKGSDGGEMENKSTH